MITPTIINTIVPESERMSFVDSLFGMSYMLKLEPAVFSIAEALSGNYTGGYWRFHDLSNGGFYMAPNFDTEFTLSCENGFQGKVSPDAFGITVCLYAYSELSFAGYRLAQVFAEHYHLLREYASQHPEAKLIHRAID